MARRIVGYMTQVQLQRLRDTVTEQEVARSDYGENRERRLGTAMRAAWALYDEVAAQFGIRQPMTFDYAVGAVMVDLEDVLPEEPAE